MWRMLLLLFHSSSIFLLLFSYVCIFVSGAFVRLSLVVVVVLWGGGAYSLLLLLLLYNLLSEVVLSVVSLSGGDGGIFSRALYSTYPFQVVDRACIHGTGIIILLLYTPIGCEFYKPSAVRTSEGTDEYIPQ